MKNNNINKKFRLKNVAKTLLILIVFVVSYLISAYTTSIYQTNIKLITLVICFVFGVILFYIVYGILYLIALCKISNKTKRLVRNEISCDERATEYFVKNTYSFSYDVKKSFSQNLKNLKSDAACVVKDISTRYGNRDENYYYLGYTVYDAIEIIDRAIDLLDSKISPLFKLLKIEDKPLKTVETALEKAINSNEEIVENKKEKKFSLFKKAGEKIAKVTAYVFRSKIEKTADDVVKFIGLKAFEIYSKSGRDYSDKDSGGNLK